MKFNVASVATEVGFKGGGGGEGVGGGGEGGGSKGGGELGDDEGGDGCGLGAHIHAKNSSSDSTTSVASGCN